MKLERRDFLKISAGATGLVLLHPSNLQKVGEAAETPADQSKLAMLVDVSKCVGCWWCYAACKQYNGLPQTITPDPEEPPELSPETWTTLFTTRKDGKWQFRKQACMHCTDAACVKVCPTGALSHNDLGFVQYDRDKCSGFCIDRVTNDQPTACAEACPTGAIKFGKRSELLEEANARVEELRKTNPDAYLYGANELGGLHVMYLLEESPEVQGLPNDPQLPPAATAHDVLQWVGVGAVGAVLAGFGLNYLVARARMVKEEKK
jgi:Fe-S-cluster-containing dehydrogenase component